MSVASKLGYVALYTAVALLAFAPIACYAQSEGVGFQPLQPFYQVGPSSEWIVSTQAIFLTRVTPNSQSIVSDTMGGEVVNTKDLKFDYQTGIELSLIKRVGNVSYFEFRFLELDGLDASTTVFNPNPAGAIGTNPPTQYGGGASRIDIDYTTRIQSGEINAGHWLTDDCRIFIGVRAVELNENFFGSIPAVDLAFDTEADNRMYGGQIGAAGQLFEVGNFAFNATGKLGLYYNHAQTDVYMSAVPDFAQFARTSDSDHIATFTAELALSGVYQVCDRVNVVVGYQMWWLDNVALAPDQLANTGTFRSMTVQPTTSLDTSSVLYHGGFAAIEILLP